MQHVQVTFKGEIAVGRLYTRPGRGNIFMYLSSNFKVVHEKNHMQLNITKAI